MGTHWESMEAVSCGGNSTPPPASPCPPRTVASRSAASPSADRPARVQTEWGRWCERGAERRMTGCTVYRQEGVTGEHRQRGRATTGQHPSGPITAIILHRWRRMPIGECGDESMGACHDQTCHVGSTEIG